MEAADVEIVFHDFENKRVTSISELQSEFVDFVRKNRIDVESVSTSFDSGEASLNEIDRACHCTEMDSFGCCAALNIGNIAFEGFAEKFPRSFAVKPGGNPGMNNMAEGRTVSRPRGIVGDIAPDQIVIDRISEAIEDGSELVAREKVKKHQNIGLL